MRHRLAMRRPLFMTPPALLVGERVGVFSVRCVDDASEQQQLFRARHKVFHAEMGLAAHLSEDTVERDASDERSAHFACFREDGGIAGYARLIYGAPELPTLKLYALQEEFASTCTEVSRLLVAPEYRRSELASRLVRSLLWGAIIAHARANDCAEIVAFGRPTLFEALAQTGLPVKKIEGAEPVNLQQFPTIYRDFVRSGELVAMRASIAAPPS